MEDEERTSIVPPLPTLSVGALRASLGTRHWPLVVDVRKEPAFAEDPTMLAGAIRRPLADVVDLLPAGAVSTRVVCYCVHGHEVSRSAARALRERGIDASYLYGGIEAWREAGAPLIRKAPPLGVPAPAPSRWITRERPKIDRIACPWLIRRFIDPTAEFAFVPAPEVIATARDRLGIAFDVPGGAIAHEGESCSFDALLRAFELRDPVLQKLAVIVRGADTGRPELAPQCAGLLAVSLGLSVGFPDDQEMLAQGMVVYDALYAWCREAPS